MRRHVATVAALLCLLPAAACGSDAGGDSGTGSGSPSRSSSSSGATRIDVVFKGDSVTPNGERVQVGAGKPVVLHVSADKPGEMHVHSSPEQELSYPAGTSTLRITIDQPGVVDVESHRLEKTIVQLEVR